MKSRIKS